SIYATNLLNFNPTGDFPGSGEQGMSGLVIDPATGDLYADMVYSSVNGVEGVPHYPKVVRFTSTDGGHTAATQTTILDMPGETMGQSHFISNLSIGPDGKLYVHVGDGFDQTKGQDLNSFRGKILRINLDGTPATDNPFYNAADGITARDYVYAYGFRNPFGGTWRAADGKHYEAENGPAVDRLAQVVAGRNYLYDGSDSSMANFATYNWNPSVAPVNLTFVQNSTFGGSGFPASKMDHLFVAESGPTYATGVQTLGKKITEFVLDAGGNLVSGPTNFVTYAGSGKGTFGALAAGPDGLYFAEIYKDQDYTSPIDQGARIFRVRYTGGTPPAVSVTPLATTDKTPALTGTVNDPVATVSITVNGLSYPAVNNGNGTWSLADNVIAPPLPDGTYDVQVSATNAFGTVGSDSTTGELVIDTTGPQITSTQFLFDSPILPGRPHTVRMVLSENIGATLTSDDLVLMNLGTESVISSANIALSYDPATRTALFTFPGFPGGVLPDGNYSVTLAPGSISDTLGNTLGATTPFNFFVLSADANHDRKVDETDLGILSLNFQQSPRTFSQGDFDYNGVVNVDDLNILASHWQQSLAAPVSSPLPPVKTPVKRPVSRVAQEVLN
ncbi:MAG TPA: PQQ-dependent sugar dehydrogenase, partial [Tepidisphaeraceae bacterium]